MNINKIELAKSFLESKMSMKDFSKQDGRSSSYLSDQIKTVLQNVYCDLYQVNEHWVSRLPNTDLKREQWLKRIEEYIKRKTHEIYPNKISWFMVCSYHQPHTKDRNYKNILIKQDQFPTIKEVQEQLQNDLGFEVEDVVLMNWKEVNKSYEL